MEKQHKVEVSNEKFKTQSMTMRVHEEDETVYCPSEMRASLVMRSTEVGEQTACPWEDLAPFNAWMAERIR